MLIGNRRWLIEKGNRERSALNSGSELWLVSVTNFGAANIIRRVVLGKFEHYAVDASDALVACNRARSRENRGRYRVGTRRTSRTMETHPEAGQAYLRCLLADVVRPTDVQGSSTALSTVDR